MGSSKAQTYAACKRRIEILIELSAHSIPLSAAYFIDRTRYEMVAGANWEYTARHNAVRRDLDTLHALGLVDFRVAKDGMPAGWVIDIETPVGPGNTDAERELLCMLSILSGRATYATEERLMRLMMMGRYPWSPLDYLDVDVVDGVVVIHHGLGLDLGLL